MIAETAAAFVTKCCPGLNQDGLVYKTLAIELAALFDKYYDIGYEDGASDHDRHYVRGTWTELSK